MDHNVDYIRKILRWVDTCDFPTSVTSIQNGAVHVKIHLPTKADGESLAVIQDRIEKSIERFKLEQVEPPFK